MYMQLDYKAGINISQRLQHQIPNPGERCHIFLIHTLNVLKHIDIGCLIEVSSWLGAPEIQHRKNAYFT